MHLNIFVSNNCFTYCKGCYSYSREEKIKSLLPSEDIINYLKYAYKRGIKKITICGGDPLTRNDIIYLLKEIKSIGFIISLDTVGTNIIDDVKINNKIEYKKINVKELTKYIDVIGIPIDGSNNEIIKLFRPTNLDIINNQIKICKELQKYNANICINTVVHKGNLNDANDISDLIKQLNVKQWQLFQFEPLGKYGFLNRKKYEITNEEFNEFRNKIVKKFKDSDVKITFKNNNDRINKYMLIDNSGNAWIPSFEKKHIRKIIGNIKNKEDWKIIFKYIKNK